MARPKKKIDEEQVYKLATYHCTDNEIASFFDVSTDTIQRRFAAIIAKGKEECKTRLRKLQLAQAERGNVSMLIWLGKQYLGQSEQTSINANITAKQVIKIGDKEIAF